MGTYRKEWPCCGDVSETNAWEPDVCPFCKPATAKSVPASKATTEPVLALRELVNLIDFAVKRNYSANSICSTITMERARLALTGSTTT